MDTLKDKNILVIGNARSGLGAAKLARSEGANVWVYDKKSYEAFKSEIQENIKQLKTAGIHFILGEEPEIEKMDKVIISPGVPLENEWIQKAYTKNIPVQGELEFASLYCKAPIIAITGTNGKTTTTALVGEIIKAYCEDTYVVGNIGEAFSESAQRVSDSGVAVAEVSSFQLETVTAFSPYIAALLNITPDHLNRHKTMDNYIDAKCNIFAYQDRHAFAVINEEDEYFDKVKSLIKAKCITFSIHHEVTCGAYVKDEWICENIWEKENKICKVEQLQLLGEHNLENIVAAIAITRAFRVPTSIVSNIVKSFRGVAHRIEYVATKKGVDFFNDSKATNTDAAIKGLLAMKKKVHLIGGGMDKKVSFKPWIELFSGRVQRLYLIGETKYQIISECKELGYNDVAAFATLKEAVVAAYEEAENEECVLLSPACASWDMYDSFEQRGDEFKEIVKVLKG